jgi:hypothetical protein
MSSTRVDRHSRFVLFDSLHERLVYPSCTLFLKSPLSCASQAGAGSILPGRGKTGLQVLHRTTEYCLISTAHGSNFPPQSRFQRQSLALHGGPIRALTSSKSSDWRSSPEGPTAGRQGRWKNLSFFSQSARPQPGPRLRFDSEGLLRGEASSIL